MAETKGLKANAISSLESVMLGIGGTAPVYSLSASTASLVAAVGFMGLDPFYMLQSLCLGYVFRLCI
ncbi:hypothetical protein NDK43_01305 [Neobacillus pocheonensis]|uniref:Uncharacterized protein n=1 Tax=Neobacillus pocheonensis TaxID=363869 RepID=A0ABT0W4P7_9BACI|nr:hypothetical protein [Neobacillus pocheonensis]